MTYNKWEYECCREDAPESDHAMCAWIDLRIVREQPRNTQWLTAAAGHLRHLDESKYPELFADHRELLVIVVLENGSVI